MVLLTPCSHVWSVPVLFHLSVLPIGHTPGRVSDFTDTFGPSHPSFLLTDKKEDIAIPPAVVMPTPSKRGRKSKQMMGRVSGVLPPGSDALILAHLTAGGQVRLAVCVCVHAYMCIVQKVSMQPSFSPSITPLTRTTFPTMRTITPTKTAPSPTGRRRFQAPSRFYQLFIPLGTKTGLIFKSTKR